MIALSLHYVYIVYLLIQSTGHVYLICVLCSGMLLIFCEQIDQHFICCWVHEFIEGQVTLMLAADWIDTSIITNSFLFWQLEHYWLPSDSFNLVIWSGTKIQWDGATRKCHLTLFQLQDELQLTFSLGYIYIELVCSFV